MLVKGPNFRWQLDIFKWKIYVSDTTGRKALRWSLGCGVDWDRYWNSRKSERLNKVSEDLTYPLVSHKPKLGFQFLIYVDNINMGHM